MQQFHKFISLLLEVYVWLNVFRATLRPSSGAYKLHQEPLERGGWSILGRGHGQKPSNCHAPTVKPEASGAAVRS
jgi:hypothetical protein